ncbi:MAG: glycoside hydrolase family 28 protein [Acidobacteria bacterium]|nr:glycoside hydrolase family 28 protein [Acidobacteriota bacterium]
MNRRELLAFAGLTQLPGGAAAAGSPAARLFDVRAHGAAGDGRTLDTKAINAAIDASHNAGGGVVYVPPGVYLTGTVIIKSNVTLYLEAGATLLGSRDLADYSPQPGPPLKGDANGKHLVFARDAENIGLCGPGRIDGQGSAFWVPSGRVAPPAADAWRDVATYDWKPLDRPSPLLEFAYCRNVRLEDVRIENASGWTVRPINCDGVVIKGIRIKNPVIGPNTDGLDPTGCQNVFISDCWIDTGDDAICLKSENPYGGDVRVSKNITITNCVLTCCCNGLKFGTATRGGFENVTFTNSVIFNEDVDPRARVISGIALEMVDGGWLEGVTISNVRMQRVRTPIFIRRGNRRPRPDGTPGPLRGVMIENIHATGAILTNSITGLPGFDVEDITLRGIRIESEEGGPEEWVRINVPEQEKSYPEARMFGRLPAYGFYCRHVRGLRLRDIDLGAGKSEARPAIACEDVKGLDLDGLRSGRIVSSQPQIRLTDSQDVWIRNTAVPNGTPLLAEARGEKVANVLVSSCDLNHTARAVAAVEGAAAESVAATMNHREK